MSPSFQVVGVSGILFMVLAVGNPCAPLHATEALSDGSDDYPRSLELRAGALREQHEAGIESIQLLLQLAEVYLDMGDDLYTEDAERLGAYLEGAKFAAQALLKDQQNAEAHFLYAANLGHAAQLRGIIEAALSIHKIMTHVKTAVALDSNHAPALHMLGMMYDGLPWIMGGNQKEAVNYLQRAVETDGSYTHARLNLAKLYIKRMDYALAKQELKAVLATGSPRGRYAWSRYHVPEAQELLRVLSSNEVSVDVKSDGN